ncbi:adenylate cyclase [Halioglobus japonicus]|uniref:Adenylate cyclase n=1 Tax=Halioglobus japonicus TaxID=930805 RepID=A0AAP8MFU0_9GAMM|nr:c-type cytochrome [Halioglobus japonicus]AQA19840.1 adenylate cyclase [Halioglobus japonicus]PLW87085.1 adenylate cyclase [Halioglobus japonicus]GHD10280.1 cytochrome c [Halioglobus japonicus]
MLRVVLLISLALFAGVAQAQLPEVSSTLPQGSAERGRLVFAPCRTCHYPEAYVGHNNGPNLSGIFGMVAGKQKGFRYYSETFAQAEFVWTPQLMYAWLESPMEMFPDTTMMSLGVPDPQDRADLIAYLLQATAVQVEQ